MEPKFSPPASQVAETSTPAEIAYRSLYRRHGIFERPLGNAREVFVDQEIGT